MNKKIVLFLFLLSLNINAQKFDGLAETPPMGWNSWNTFGTDINEKLVKDIADQFIELGLKDAGYEYIVLDDGWMSKERDVNGDLVADPIKFPSGMKVLADYIHSKGLKFGLYNCAGSKTCAGYPGSRGHEYQDAKLYASWEVDYLKYDWCNTGKINAESAYITMRDALKAAGRPVVFSICEWGDNEPWKWGKEVGHLWRATGDIINCWDCEIGHGSWSSSGVWTIINMRKDIRESAGPGHWNDFDMMEVGNGMTAAEDRSHFVMWSMLASPLIMGNDLREMSKETLSTLINKEVISVNQDKLGIQGFRFSNENKMEIWIKPLDNNQWALSFVNMSDDAVDFVFDWQKHPLSDDVNGRYLDLNKEVYEVRDLTHHQNLGDTSKKLKAKIASHDVVVVRIGK
ncbi:glycoside hydrolase family 27 protein [Wenyingzhuangia sp. chi5]|uniref:Alpha-galactosidase n=1 Tax=Wenyingzhuangia gilva TaxID=3057677 RepID=A0ABT8VTS0_9FLAO|nr:glycoside hydrolase family 27 protein [Wenyingzhuangia sp. chi5]MDO3695374.1 glycoside hydrolase family 27 protein [Wenyingzhuangia sp. chi5]